MNAWQTIEEEAEKLQARDPALTSAQAITRILGERPGLARDYSDNREAIHLEMDVRQGVTERYHETMAHHHRRPKSGSMLATLNDEAAARAARTGETVAQAFTVILHEQPDRYTTYRQEVDQ